MKKKTIIAILAAIIALSAIGISALGFLAPENAASVTARFSVLESDETGSKFSMISEDGQLVIYITENTLIQFEDYVPLSDECEDLTKNVREVLFGRTLAEVLEGRNLLVIFEESQRIEPISITILFEAIATLPIDIDSVSGYDDTIALPGEIEPEGGYIGIEPPIGEIDYIGSYMFELNGEIVVNNEILEGAPLPFWYEAENGSVVMVPLNVVAEALGYDVSWNDELQGYQLGVAINLWIGNTEAHVGRMAPIELSAAPMLLDDIVFVPLDFFRSVLAQTAYVFEGQVVVETYSDMM